VDLSSTEITIDRLGGFGKPSEDAPLKLGLDGCFSGVRAVGKIPVLSHNRAVQCDSISLVL
jgi:hypothetical protein